MAKYEALIYTKKNRMVSTETRSKWGLSEHEPTQTAGPCERCGRLAGPACRWLTVELDRGFEVLNYLGSARSIRITAKFDHLNGHSFEVQAAA